MSDQRGDEKAKLTIEGTSDQWVALVMLAGLAVAWGHESDQRDMLADTCGKIQPLVDQVKAHLERLHG